MESGVGLHSPFHLRILYDSIFCVDFNTGITCIEIYFSQAVKKTCEHISFSSFYPDMKSNGRDFSLQWWYCKSIKMS